MKSIKCQKGFINILVVIVFLAAVIGIGIHAWKTEGLASLNNCYSECQFQHTIDSTDQCAKTFRENLNGLTKQGQLTGDILAELHNALAICREAKRQALINCRYACTGKI